MRRLTKEQASAVADIIGYAEDGAESAVKRLAGLAEKAFPGWKFELGEEKVDRIIVRAVRVKDKWQWLRAFTQQD